MKFSEAKAFIEGVTTYNLDQLQANLAHGRTRASDFVIPMLEGDPGVGKTAIPQAAARTLELDYGQAIVAQYDAGELAGIPFIKSVEREEINDEGEVITVKDDVLFRQRPDWMPNFDIGLFNLDELVQAFLANQNVCSQFVNEYRVGHHAISHGITVVCTGNKASNKAGTTTMPTHLRDRLLFLTIEADGPEFIEYAAEKGLDPRVRAYIRQYPQHLAQFDATAQACPSPRSWEKASSILRIFDKMAGSPQSIRLRALIGQLGEGEATQFDQWLRVEKELPDPDSVIADPKTAPVFKPDKASILYLLLASLADKATPKNIGNILTYLRRLPNAEFQAYCGQDILRSKKEVVKTPEFRKWMMQEGVALRL